MPQLRILMVEDCAADIYQLKGLVAATDLRASLDCVPDGPSALARLEGETFSLIMVAVPLAGASRLALVSTIRSDPRHANIPVVVLASSGSDDAVLAALDAGADQYIEKPLDETTLQKVLSSTRAFAYTVSRRA